MNMEAVVMRTQYFKFILSLLHKNRFKFIYTILIVIMLTIFSLIQPLIIKNIVDVIISDKQYNTIIILLLQLISVFLIYEILTFFKALSINNLNESLSYSIRLETYSKIVETKLYFFNERTLGELQSILLKEIPEIISFLIDVSFDLLIHLGTFIILIIIMFKLNYAISSVTLFFTILYCLIINKTNKMITICQEDLIKQDAELEGVLIENIVNIKTIKFLYVLDFFKERFSKSIMLYIKYKNRLVQKSAAINLITQIIVFLPLLFLFSFGGYSVIQGSLTLGTMIAITDYMQRFIISTDEIQQVNVRFRRIKVLLDRLINITNNTSTDSKDEKKQSVSLVQSISLNNISVVNENTPLITNYSNCFKIGEIIKISGNNGCGKTTLLNCLCGILPLDSGEILFDTININSINSLKLLIGYVPQKTELFSMSVRENILLDNTNTDKNILELSHNIGFKDFNLRFLNKKVINRGINLSEGQKQKICILRTLIRNNPILIFDESTSSLDASSKHKLYKYLLNIKKDHIIFIVDHSGFTEYDKEIFFY